MTSRSDQRAKVNMDMVYVEFFNELLAAPLQSNVFQNGDIVNFAITLDNNGDITDFSKIDLV